jgi:hypothetical protein
MFFVYSALNENVLTSYIAAFLCVALFFLAFVASNLLQPLNLLWYKLGMLLGKIVSPIVLGAIFFLMITPVALFLRLLKRDELRLKLASTNWKSKIETTDIDSFKNQF